MVLKRLPFEFANSENIHYRMIEEKRYNDFWKMHSEALLALYDDDNGMIEDFKDLFISMVNCMPEDRPTIKEVLKAPWMKGRQTIIRSLKKLI